MSETPSTTIRVGSAPSLREDPPVSLRAEDMLAPPTAAETAGPSPLEQLRTALAAPVDAKPCVLRVPSRPGVTLEFSTELSNEQRLAWQRRATKKSRRAGRDDEVDEMLFACLVLANQHRATLFNGVAAHDPSDGALTFAHPQLWQMVNPPASDPQSAIRGLFGNDAHVLLASGEVLLASGFDDDLEAADPTTAS